MPARPLIANVSAPRVVSDGELVEIKVTVVNKGDTGGVFIMAADVAGVEMGQIVVRQVLDEQDTILYYDAEYTAKLHFIYRSGMNVYVLTGPIEVQDSQVVKTGVTDYRKVEMGPQGSINVWPLAIGLMLGVAGLGLVSKAGRTIRSLSPRLPLRRG